MVNTHIVEHDNDDFLLLTEALKNDSPNLTCIT